MILAGSNAKVAAVVSVHWRIGCLVSWYSNGDLQFGIFDANGKDSFHAIYLDAGGNCGGGGGDSTTATTVLT